MGKHLVEIKSKSPLLLAKNNGDLKSNETYSDEELADKSCYRHNNGNLGIPTINIKSALVDGMVSNYDNKTYKMKKLEIYPDISIETTDESDVIVIDLGTNDYDIFKRSVLIRKRRDGSFEKASHAVNARINLWKCKFILENRTKDYTSKDMEKILELTGKRIGICGFRKGGFGRFEIVSFKEIE